MHKALNPLGTLYLKLPIPLASLFPPALVAPANVLSCPKFNIPLNDEFVVAEPSPVIISRDVVDGVPAELLPVAGLPEF